MYLGFNLEADVDFTEWYDKGRVLYKQNSSEVEKNLRKYLYEGTEIYNGSLMANEWFPKIKVDVFLSHSHIDKEKAIGLAGWLEENFNLTVFIDSCIWGHANDLLKMIDDKHCLNDDETMYDYNKRNYSTSHVHMMLSMALTKMMDKAELVIFMNTENSVQPVNDTISQATKSPWVYSELVLTNLIRKKNPGRKVQKSMEKHTLEEAKRLDVAYPVDELLNRLIPLKYKNLVVWRNQFSKNSDVDVHPLDYLYSQFEKSN
ncbi:hypothetical protein SAMN04488081_1246 [Salimicrobium album]|uniref:TIR domain-containing protein n=2 Tax=Salimicrobium album TaxID=50717 RepID=A0A1H3E6N8_9BACI|nr:hypothetical protein SAMN04488081_1246 [Salimicrobium album]